MIKKNFAVILSGCGARDGSEINEVVLTLLALEQLGSGYQCFAPDIDQKEVVDHLTGQSSTDLKRNLLKEAARIVRGKIKPIGDCCVDEWDGVIVPGGFGVAKNLSTFAYDGAALKIEPEVLSILTAFKNAKKPAGYICIAPVLAPLVYGKGIVLTIGNDANTIAIIETLGGVHKNTNVDGITVDAAHKVVTTPAYMLANSITEAKSGIDKLVAELIKMA